MKKVGIITLNGYFNYGNRLQNYALQEVIKSYGFDVETIWVVNKRNFSDSSIMQKVKNSINRPIKENIMIINKKVQGKLYKNKLDEKRTEIFHQFSEKYINETSFKISRDYIPDNLSEQYDYFVTGSDQVWNPHFRKGDPTYFLTFAPKEKRIAYAPSFGTDSIPEEYQEKYRKWINDMYKLSVREEMGAKIIKGLTGKDVPVLVDPTLLLTKEKWLSISTQIKENRNYLLTYFLGNISKETKKLMNKLAKKYNLKIIHLAQPKDRIHYLTGPSEFISYINSATLFLTDSFHGAVFSILLETPFVAFNRVGKFPSMNSRINTLLSTFKFEDRHINNLKDYNHILNMDFSHVNQILHNERKRGFNYLEVSFGINNKYINTKKRVENN